MGIESIPLQREDSRLEASEMLRGLIDSIVLTPENGQLRIEWRGNLAAMLGSPLQLKCGLSNLPMRPRTGYTMR